jgi:hypothetical protein
MAIQYTNRIGRTYFLHEGKTKSGKPRYFFSTQKNGKSKVVDHIPDEYEIYEHPENAQVFLRKKRPQLITDIEIQLIKKYVKDLKRSKRYRVDYRDEYITVYESNLDVKNLEGIFGNFIRSSPSNSEADVDEAMNAFASVADRQYTAVLRFRLDEERQRTFTVERFCFRGAIDDWIYLDGPNNLKSLVEKYVNSLGTEEFFDSLYY